MKLCKRPGQIITLVLLCAVAACVNATGHTNAVTQEVSTEATYDTTLKVIHIFVALCDNKYQGIVPVPKAIGNGQDPANNLYWGCGYGVRTFFRRSAEWKFISSSKPGDVLMERLVFKHTSKPYCLVADAYNGQYIKQCTHDFLSSACGQAKDTLNVGGRTIGIMGNSALVAYTGHDGLMDFVLTQSYKNTDNRRRDVIILACYSKRFFGPYLENANVNPLVWTTNLMCPEAYTTHDALAGYVTGESNEQIRTRAATAYDRYQKCGLKAARGLLTTGW